VDPENTAKQRASGCFPELAAYKAGFADATQLAQVEAFPQLVDSSSYFRLTSVVRIGTTQFALYSLLLRANGRVQVVMRSYSPD